MTIDAQPEVDSRPVVLVIDDSPDVHRILRARLKQEEIELEDAPNGEVGISKAKSLKPSLILLDLDMSPMDGFEVMRRLKNDKETGEIPIIMLSGMQATQDKVTAFELGAVDYITKPFEFTELRVRLRSALKMQRMVQLLSDRARVDGLTSLSNRAFFDARWTEENSRVARQFHPLALAIIDLDHFKSVNDSFGHPAGDLVLQGFGEVLRQQCRTADVPCRYGGEEFAVILPDTTPTAALVLCDRIRVAIESVVWARHPERKITCSIGIAGFGDTVNMSPEQVIQAADKALYAAKRGGRNRIVVHGLEPIQTAA